mgnify:CR=1 FL=1
MLNINPWNMVMIVINLLVLYAIFRKFLYKPVMNVIHRREELIQGQFDSAKKTQDDALQLKADYEEKLQKANVKADEIILAARDQAKEEHEKAVLETQAKTDRMIEKAKADIEKTVTYQQTASVTWDVETTCTYRRKKDYRDR